jgi:hypothetical protein
MSEKYDDYDSHLDYNQWYDEAIRSVRQNRPMRMKKVNSFSWVSLVDFSTGVQIVFNTRNQKH